MKVLNRYEKTKKAIIYSFPLNIHSGIILDHQDGEKRRETDADHKECYLGGKKAWQKKSNTEQKLVQR